MAVNWKQVGLFVGITYALTIVLDAGVWLAGGLQAPGAVAMLQLQVLLPAFVAIVLRRYGWRDSTIHVSHYRERPRWIFNGFLVFVAVQVAVVVGSVLNPASALGLSALTTLAGFAGSVLLFLTRIIHQRRDGMRDAFDRAGLRLGRARDWALWWMIFVVYYASQTALNALFGLGHPVDLTEVVAGTAAASAAQDGMPLALLPVVAFVQSVIFAPVLIALFTAFGEEYGWRGLLQDQLTRLGRVRGVALLGVIWGVWHLPAIVMGHNYPGRPLLGAVLMMVYSVELAFVLGYVMLKTRAIWLVSFLHAVNNHTLQVLSGLVYAPNDPVVSFGGIGLYSLIILAGLVALLLRDPVWRCNHRV